MIARDPGHVPSADPHPVVPRHAGAVRSPGRPAVPPGLSRVMFRYGGWVCRVRWIMVAFWIAALLTSIPFALKSPSVLQGGGYFNISSESVDVDNVLSQKLGRPLSQVVIAFRSAATSVDDPAYQREVAAFAARARSFPHTTSATVGVAGEDGRTTYVLVGFDRDPDYMQREMAAFRALLPDQDATNPARAYLTGTPAVYDTLTRVTVEDVERADAIALPIALVVLLIVFGTVVAATMPLLLGITAVPVALAIIYAIALHTPTTTFILSVASIIGLGISIDYSLLITRRYREELHRSRQRHQTDHDAAVREAVATTIATAGVSVLFSGIVVIIGFLGLLAIGVPITTSFAIGGAVVVAAAVLAALTLLPALLGVLGTRVNAWRIPLVHRRARRPGRSPGTPAAGDGTPVRAVRDGGGWWHAWALGVMRRPGITILLVAVLLVLLGWPAWMLKVGVPGAEVLPWHTSERQGLAILQQQFPDLAQEPIYVVAQTRDGGRILSHDSLAELDRLTAWVAAREHVTSVTGLTRPPADPGAPALTASQLITLYSSGTYQQTPGLARFAASVAADDTTVIVARSDTTLDSEEGKALIDVLRSASPTVTQLHVRVGGLQALSLDLDRALYRNFPRTILIILGATYLLLLVMFRSLLLPLKAVLMNTLSVAATFGALVYIFQWGNLGFPRVEFINAIIPILLFCILFGLSMDYEVFLLSRIREEWLRTGDNQAAVALGLEKTAGVITSAALLFVIVTGAFAFASLVTTQEIGVGMTVAVLLDATVIRLLLVPATMRLLGRWNWWLPGRPVPHPPVGEHGGHGRSGTSDPTAHVPQHLAADDA
jgi:RND superfamily putative drug exporter